MPMTPAPLTPGTRQAPARHVAALLLAGTALAAGLPALAQEAPPPPAETQKEGEPGGIPYTVDIDGVEEYWLRELLGGVSSLMNLREEPPPSPIGLRSRARADQERLAAALRSEGFHDHTLDIEVDVESRPAKARIAVVPGTRYTLEEVRVETPEGAPMPGGPIEAARLQLEIGDPARGPEILDAQDEVGSAMAERGYAYARVVDRRLVVDTATKKMHVTFVTDPGPETRLGEIRFEGLDRVKAKAAARRAEWKPGDLYKPDLVTETRDNLAELDVFNSIRLGLPETPPAQSGTVTVPVIARVAERERRFVGFGVNYSTFDGFGANAYWGHRNFMGGAERLRVAAEISGVGRDGYGDPGEFDYRLTGEYREPDFLARSQSLILTALLVSESPEAFSREAAILTGIVERELAEGLTVSGGITFEQSRVTENLQTTQNTLLGFPGTINWDNSDDLLNPTSGFRLSAAVTPYTALLGDSSSFVLGRVGGSAYYPFDEDGRYVAAARLAVGSAVGGKTLNVPADKRFYAGGGGSVRGYGYQEVGPRDPEGDPLGGRSLFEVSAEMRIRVTENIGIVPFLDGGNVYTSEYPDFSENLRWGAGLGVRYITPLGPLRADVGFPLNKRRGDSSWQLYISIGQAF